MSGGGTSAGTSEASLRWYRGCCRGWDIGRDIARRGWTREAPASLRPSAMTWPVIQGAGCMAVNQSGGGGSGQGVAAAFLGGHPGELGVVDQFLGLADADDAPALDPGIPLDRGRVAEGHPPQRAGERAGDQPVAVLAPAVGVAEPAQVGLVHRHDQPVPGLAALPFDLPPLVQRGRLALPVAALVHPRGHRGEGAELIDDQQPLREQARPGGVRADGDVDPEHGQEEFFQRPHHRFDVGVHPDAGHVGEHVVARSCG